MNQHSETQTIQYYDEHADEYVRATVSVNMGSLYEPFLSHVPPSGRILDAGCGSGRDSKEFLGRGYRVTSIDASQKMVHATTALTAQKALRMAFEEVGFSEKFDGVWACASLLHVPLRELPGIIGRLASVLRPSGVFYASFKMGLGERNQDGRLFTDIDEVTFTSLISGVGELELLRLWHSDDRRPTRNDQWLNALLRKAVAD